MFHVIAFFLQKQIMILRSSQVFYFPNMFCEAVSVFVICAVLQEILRNLALRHVLFLIKKCFCIVAIRQYRYSKL